MDRIDRIGRSPLTDSTWAVSPPRDREEQERHDREREERRRREQLLHEVPLADDEPPHLIDVRA
jgi:hypothetical protein